MRQLPPAFVEDMLQWSAQSRVPPVVTRYFITGDKRKILLEHDEDYCTPPAGAIPASSPPPNMCQQMNADAADIDLIAAYDLDQTNHATNATAWMIDPDATAWIQIRDNICSTWPNPPGLPDPDDARADAFDPARHPLDLLWVDGCATCNSQSTIRGLQG
jgi:hypothetical protein